MVSKLLYYVISYLSCEKVRLSRFSIRYSGQLYIRRTFNMQT